LTELFEKLKGGRFWVHSVDRTRTSFHRLTNIH